MDVTLLVHFLARAASIIFLSIFGHKIGVLKFVPRKRVASYTLQLQGNVFLIISSGGHYGSVLSLSFSNKKMLCWSRKPLPPQKTLFHRFISCAFWTLGGLTEATFDNLSSLSVLPNE